MTITVYLLCAFVLTLPLIKSAFSAPCYTEKRMLSLRKQIISKDFAVLIFADFNKIRSVKINAAQINAALINSFILIFSALFKVCTI